MVASDDSDHSIGLLVVERAYIRSVERAGLEGSDDSGEDTLENSSEEEENSEEGDGNDGVGGGDGDVDNARGKMPPA